MTFDCDTRYNAGGDRCATLKEMAMIVEMLPMTARKTACRVQVMTEKRKVPYL